MRIKRLNILKWGTLLTICFLAIRFAVSGNYVVSEIYKNIFVLIFMVLIISVCALITKIEYTIRGNKVYVKGILPGQQEREVLDLSHEVSVNEDSLSYRIVQKNRKSIQIIKRLYDPKELDSFVSRINSLTKGSY